MKNKDLIALLQTQDPEDDIVIMGNEIKYIYSGIDFISLDEAENLETDMKQLYPMRLKETVRDLIETLEQLSAMEYPCTNDKPCPCLYCLVQDVKRCIDD